MELSEYLRKKKIDPEEFKKSEPERWEEFSAIFPQLHPQSFTFQKKFLLNDLRKKYPCKNEPTVETSGTKTPQAVKPAIKIAPKIKKSE